MKKYFFGAALSVILLTALVAAPVAGAAAPAEALTVRLDWLPCTVSDPTGTPLNVRARPNGRIVTTLKNGTLVEIDDATAGGKWSRISFRKNRKSTTGWVLRAYLSCQ